LAEALTYASHLINWLPSSVIGGDTLMEFGPKKLLKIMICSRYLNIHPTITKKDKLDPREKKAMFLGSKRVAKGYKL